MRLAAILVLAACGGAPPRPPPEPDPPVATPSGHARRHHTDEVAEPARTVRVPRPEIASLASVLQVPEPDLSDHLRWPLTANRHPSLEPAYAIAPVFAAPGMAWTDLCHLGAQNRRTSGALTDQTEYLRAWCDVERRETVSAVSRLGALLRSPVLGLAAAARADIANILVDAGDADQAERFLAAAKIRDLAVIDLLAASYIEVGKTRDGAQLNDLAIGSYDFLRPQDQCARLTRRFLLTLAVPDFTPYLGNRSCLSLANEVACVAQRSCGGYLVSQGVPMTFVGLANVYFVWPEGEVDAARWQAVADAAYAEIGTPGADVLATAAWEAVVRTSDCDRHTTDAITLLALKVKLSPVYTSALDSRLEVLVHTPTALCLGPPP